MNTVLWILQAILAVLYLLHGTTYVALPKSMLKRMRERRPEMQPPTISPAAQRVIGVLEWLGAAGLVLPAIAGVATWLTPVAAAGLMILMNGAAGYHLGRKEREGVILTGVLYLLLAFVAFMRWQVEPLAA